MAQVINYATGSTMVGGVSAGLLHASRNAAPTGAVSAYCDEVGLWLHVPEGQESAMRACGHEVVTVYVEE